MIGNMSAPFQKIFPDELKVPVSSVRALFEAYRTRKQTGVIRLISENAGALYLLLKNGEVLNTYLIIPQGWKHVSLETRDAWINSAGNTYTKFIPLSAQGLLICKLLIEGTAERTETLVRSVDIGEYLDQQKKAPGMSLVHLEWEKSMGAVLFSGSSAPPDSFFISSDNLYDQATIAPLLKPGHPNCEVALFGFDSSVSAWQEYLLRRIFADVCERTLSQFQMLTGRALVNSLVRLIIAFASRCNLNINISSQKVVDNEVFSSPQQAADNYHQLLTEMLVHASGITGSRLLSSTVKEIVETLPAEERAIIKNFPLFAEGYIYERRN
jgi:hypothetical protein